ncbi:MAG: transposase [Planctomycetes bacterium]|nr:transposase [Planctomycetota bacterium]
MSDSKRQEWIARLKRFQEQTTSVQAFCRSEGVSSASFYLWRRRLAQESGETPLSNSFVPLTIAHLSTPAPTTSVEVAFPSGIVFRLPADEQSLRTLFALAREQPC